jgi:predicted DCC family thiol-disulfide oxidoreductase YuxK
MPSAIAYPLVVYYDAASRDCAAKVERLRSRDTGGRLRLVDCSRPGIRACDARGRWLVGIVALEWAYRAAWDGEVSL